MAQTRKSDPLPYVFLLFAVASLGAEIYALVRALSLLMGN
jgi:hypothetical protein